MPEINDVETGGIIASEWGNQVRSRTVQRYADAAARTSQHPTPAQGDLSFLANTGHVEVFGPGGWEHVAFGFSYEVDGSNQVDGSLSLTTSFAAAASVSLVIPTGWGSWKCEAWGRLVIGGISGVDQAGETRIVIDGTAGQVIPDTDTQLAVGAYRTGITTTGSRTVALQARRVSGSGGSVSRRYLYARAVRVT